MRGALSLALLCGLSKWSRGASALQLTWSSAPYRHSCIHLVCDLRTHPATRSTWCAVGSSEPRQLQRLRGGAPSVSASMATSTPPSGLRLIDTCVNLQVVLSLRCCCRRATIAIAINSGGPEQDTMFQGIYNDKQKHEPDWESIMERAAVNGVHCMRAAVRAAVFNVNN